MASGRRRGRRGSGMTTYMIGGLAAGEGDVKAASMPPLGSPLYEPDVPRRWIVTPYTYQVRVRCPWCTRLLREVSCREPFTMPGHPRVRVIPLEQAVDKFERHEECEGWQLPAQEKIDAAIERAKAERRPVWVRAVRQPLRAELGTVRMRLVRGKSTTRLVKRRWPTET